MPPTSERKTSGAEASEAGASANAVLEGVVVTARRREEQVQDVPLAISVVNAATLENTGTFNVGKLSQLQPSIQFYSSNPRNSAANIRGLGAPFGLTNDGIEQGVGIYIDQVYYARSATATFDFLDTPASEIGRYLSSSYKLPLETDSRLNAAPVTSNISGTSLQNALGAVCDQHNFRIRWKDGKSLILEPLGATPPSPDPAR